MLSSWRVRGAYWGAASREGGGGEGVAEWQGRILAEGSSGGGFRVGEAQEAAWGFRGVLWANKPFRSVIQ